MKPAVLSAELRMGRGRSLGRRRAIIALQCVSIASLGVVTLYQTGVIAHLPDPPLRAFDSDKVDASSEAYKLLDMPDGALGVANACATLLLAAMGGENRAQTRPWLPLALAGKAAWDVAQSGRLFLNQITKQHALCLYCTVATLTSLATAPLVFGEAWTALSVLRGARAKTAPLQPLRRLSRRPA